MWNGTVLKSRACYGDTVDVHCLFLFIAHPICDTARRRFLGSKDHLRPRHRSVPSRCLCTIDSRDILSTLYLRQIGEAVVFLHSNEAFPTIVSDSKSVHRARP